MSTTFDVPVSGPPLQVVVTKPTAVVTKGRWVDNDGNQMTVANARARGLARQGFSASEVSTAALGFMSITLAVVILGYESAELGDTVADNTWVTTDNQGRTIAATAGAEILGFIEKGGDVGDKRPVFVVTAISNPRVPSAAIADLTGAGSGSANGSLVAEGTVATAGGNTYSDAAVNTVIGKIEDNIAELAATQHAILVALRAQKIIAP